VSPATGPLPYQAWKHLHRAVYGLRFHNPVGKAPRADNCASSRPHPLTDGPSSTTAILCVCTRSGTLYARHWAENRCPAGRPSLPDRTLVVGVAHTLVKQRCLQPTTPQLRNRSRAAEQSNAIMNAQHASSAGFPVMFGEEAQTLVACRRYATEVQKKYAKFGMFVRPAPGADFTPQLRFFRGDDPRTEHSAPRV
jgi:hypothetical protein